MSVSMTDKIKFTYDQDTRTLKINDGGEVKVYKLDDKKNEIFYYILKAIDILDDEAPEGTTATWARIGNTDLIPMEKLNVGGDPGQIATISESGTIPPTEIFPDVTPIEVPDEDAIVYTFVGGGA